MNIQIPLYNVQVFFNRRENNSWNTMSYDGYAKDGSAADGPPIVDLILFVSWLFREKGGFKFIMVYRHSNGEYLKTFSRKVGLPDAALYEDCTTGERMPGYVMKYPPYNEHWKRLQKKSGILRRLETEAPAPVPGRQYDLLEPMTPKSKPPTVRFVDQDGDPEPAWTEIENWAKHSPDFKSLKDIVPHYHTSK